VLAEGVDLLDRRPTGQKKAGGYLFILQGQSRNRERKERRAPSGEEAEDQVFWAESHYKAQDLGGPRKPRPIGNRMTGLDRLYLPELERVAISLVSSLQVTTSKSKVGTCPTNSLKALGSQEIKDMPLLSMGMLNKESKCPVC
jgi:hypothetical protein